MTRFCRSLVVVAAAVADDVAATDVVAGVGAAADVAFTIVPGLCTSWALPQLVPFVLLKLLCQFIPLGFVVVVLLACN